MGTLVNLSGAAADKVRTVTEDTLDTTVGGGAAWLRVCDVAALLGVSRNTVRRWSDDGVLPSYRSAGGHRRYVRDDIMATIAARRTGELETPGDRHPEPADADLVGELRRQVAMLTERLAERDRDLGRQNKLMSELVELGAIVPGTTDVKSAFSSLGSRLIETLDADTCELYSLQGDRIELLAGFDRAGLIGPWLGWTGDIRDFPASAAALARHEVLIIAAPDDPRLSAHERERYIKFDYQKRDLRAARGRRQAHRLSRHLRHKTPRLRRVRRFSAGLRAGAGPDHPERPAAARARAAQRRAARPGDARRARRHGV